MFEMTKMRMINADSGLDKDGWKQAIEEAVKKNADRITDVIDKEVKRRINTMAKLNRKKTSKDVLENLTMETKAKFMVSPSSSGKVFLYDKPKKRFTTKNLRRDMP